MKLPFSAYRTYVARDKHDPRRRWLVYQFKTSRGVVTLMRELRASRVKRTRTVAYYRDGSGHWRERSGSRVITEVLQWH